MAQHPISPFFLISSLVSFIALLFVVFGVKVFASVQKVIMVFGVAGTVIILLGLHLHHLVKPLFRPGIA